MKRIRFFVILGSILGLALSSFFMIKLPLWGYWPLLNFLSLFSLFIGVNRYWIIDKSGSIRPFLMSVSAGVILSIGFPPSPIFIGMALGMIPLLMMEREILSLNQRPRPGQLFKSLFTAFWLWNILTTFWVANTAYVAGILANMINAALMTLPWLLFHLVSYKSTHWTRYVLLACLWIGFEKLHMTWEMSWPWLSLGNGLATVYPLAQWYEFTGFYGGAVWLWVLNILGFFIFLDLLPSRKKLVSIALAVFFIPILFSLTLYSTYKEKGEVIDVTIIQPNYEPHYQKFDIPEYVQLRSIEKQIEGNIDQNTSLVLLPETVFDPVYMDSVYLRSQPMVTLNSLLDKYPACHILLGIGGYHTFTENPGRETVRERDGFIYEQYNAALMISRDKSNVQEYHKSKFVPGAEIFPFKKVLYFLKPLIRKLGGTYEGFAPQDEPSNFSFEGKKVAPIICYESVYGDWVRQYVAKGAGLLAIVTNDGWWDDTPGHIQHLQIGRLRAIECRKDIIRSANTGISCIIDQKGEIKVPTAYEVDAVIKSQAFYQTDQTFYTQYGDLILWPVFGIGLILLIYFIRQIFTRD